jgi:hypothetical protein
LQRKAAVGGSADFFDLAQYLRQMLKITAHDVGKIMYFN